MDSTAGPDHGAAVPFRLRSRPVVAWAMYDFANTIFSVAVISFYYNEWVVDDLGAADWKLGAMNFLVSLLLVLTLPAIGAIADLRRLRVPFLAAFTLACIVATAAITFADGVLSALILGGAAIFCYQSALAHYDPLLADVAPEEHRGPVSGLGVGLGYIGALFGAGVLFVVIGDGDKQNAFLPTALMYLVFALPALFWVRERKRPVVEGTVGRVVRDAGRQLATTTRHIRSSHPETLRFLVARFLYADAFLTVIAVLGIYMERVGDFDATTKLTVQALSMVSAALGAFVAGRLVQSRGPRWVLSRILVVGVITLAGAAASGAPGSVWILGPLVGVVLGGIWTSDRVFMMRLSPPSARGEFFSIYSLVGRVSSGIGPLFLWGGTVYLFHERFGWSELGASRVALVSLAIAALWGWWLVRGIDDAPRDWSDDPLEREIQQEVGP